MLVSIVISAYNEEKYLPRLFEDLLQQTYSKKNIEIILINAMSTDKTRELMEQFKEKNSDFYDIKVLNNERKTQPSGFNLGVKNSNGNCILKIDAHSSVPKNFVEKNIETIKSGQDVCGGKRPTIVEANDNFSKTLHLVEENMFGSSIAGYRKQEKNGYVKSIFHGMYKKEVFDKVGLLDEQLIRTEDNEIHYRIRKNGYKIFYNKDIVSYQYIRPTLSKMIRQKFLNGYWIGLTSHVKPECLSIFHFVPFVFLIAIISSSILLLITKIFFLLLLGAYSFFTIIITLFTIINNKFNLTLITMPVLLFLIHIFYGLGTFIGLIKGFSWKKQYYKEK